MMQTPKRIQGTDGIRGRVKPLSQTSYAHPLDAWDQEQLLTDQFFEQYAYAYGMVLQEHSFAQKGDPVVVGWDSRDPEGIYNQSVVRGLQKAGLTVWEVGILPTPAVSLYMLETRAVCSFVVTASHNPSDQNGIKIFIGHSGLKLFPQDDEILTQKLYSLKNTDISNLPLEGQHADHHTQAFELFQKFCIDRRNSWLQLGTFENTTLVVDAANGAVSDSIRQLLTTLQCTHVHYTNCDPKQPINVHSGVADLEGHSRISAQSIESGAFQGYSTLETLLSEGRQQRDALQTSDAICTALVFDGDGDRCFRVDYDPFEDDLIVSSGDALSYVTASYFQQTHKKTDPALFVNTVESDLACSGAVQELGYSTWQTAVGDKWILWQAVLQDWKVRCACYEEYAESEAFQTEVSAWKQTLQSLEHNLDVSALSLTQQFLQVEAAFQKECVLDPSLTAFKEPLPKVGGTPFLVGSEASGHVITPAILHTSDSEQLVYLGNGVKSGINALSMMAHLRPSNPQDYYQWLANPYETGVEQGWTVYYVDKQKMLPEHPFRAQLSQKLQEALSTLPQVSEIQEMPRPEEPELLFFQVHLAEKRRAFFFARNSGTEDKMSLYLRAYSEDQSALAQVGQSLAPFLQQEIKNTHSPFAKAEKAILEFLQKHAGASSEELPCPSDLAKGRLLHEMSSKQKLIEGNAQNWRLASLGQSLL